MCMAHDKDARQEMLHAIIKELHEGSIEVAWNEVPAVLEVAKQYHVTHDRIWCVHGGCKKVLSGNAVDGCEEEVNGSEENV